MATVYCRVPSAARPELTRSPARHETCSPLDLPQTSQLADLSLLNVLISCTRQSFACLVAGPSALTSLYSIDASSSVFNSFNFWETARKLSVQLSRSAYRSKLSASYLYPISGARPSPEASILPETNCSCNERSCAIIYPLIAVLPVSHCFDPIPFRR